jgi:hypothetical protein
VHAGLVVEFLKSECVPLYLGSIKIIHFIQCDLQISYGFLPNIFHPLFKCEQVWISAWAGRHDEKLAIWGSSFQIPSVPQHCQAGFWILFSVIKKLITFLDQRRHKAPHFTESVPPGAGMMVFSWIWALPVLRVNGTYRKRRECSNLSFWLKVIGETFAWDPIWY